MSVRVERRGPTAELVVDRPPLNILDLATLAELAGAVEGLADDSGVRLVVVRGAGERAFSAGVAVEDHTPDRIESMLGDFHRGIRALRSLPCPTLAVVRGHCLGGGFELALACDLVLAADDARFGLPEVKLGCFPPVAAALLPRRIGAGRTLEMLATGRTFAVAEAVDLGLATWSAPAAGLAERQREIEAALTAASGPVVQLIQRAVRAGERLGFAEALAEAERLYLEELVEVADMEEGLAAFREKREPRWRHR